MNVFVMKARGWWKRRVFFISSDRLFAAQNDAKVGILVIQLFIFLCGNLFDMHCNFFKQMAVKETAHKA